MTSRRIRCLTRRNAARGIEDILIAVVDGLKGFPEAIEAVFPQTMTQTCIVHLIRHALESKRSSDALLLSSS
jgi:transposase-like protein